jgi:hypothetical protein
MASQRDCLADSRLAPFWVRRVVLEFTTLNPSMLRPATGRSAGQSGMVIEEFGSDHAFKFAIERPHARGRRSARAPLKGSGKPYRAPAAEEAQRWTGGKAGTSNENLPQLWRCLLQGRQQRILILQNDNCRAEERDGDESAAEIHFDVNPTLRCPRMFRTRAPSHF